jgi:hypothetical protein
MKSITSILAIGAATVGVLSSTAAEARFKTDALAGPGDITMVQSALTTTPNDGRATGSSPYVSQSTSDWYGNDRWGAGFYVYGYSGTSPGGWSYATNYFSVNARANYDTRFSVIQAQVSAAADYPTLYSNVSGTVYAMGNLIRNVTRGGAQFNNTWVMSEGNTPDLFKAKAEYDIYGVTVWAEARVFGRARQTISGRVWVDGITNGVLDQSAGVFGEVTGGAKVLGGALAGGVSLKDLSLTQLRFPLVSTARWNGFSPAPGACVSIAYAGGTHSTQLQWLSGRIVLWGSAAWGLFKDEYEIAKWDGITKSWHMMNYPVSSRQVGGTCFPGSGGPPVI